MATCKQPMFIIIGCAPPDSNSSDKAMLVGATCKGGRAGDTDKDLGGRYPYTALFKDLRGQWQDSGLVYYKHPQAAAPNDSVSHDDPRLYTSSSSVVHQFCAQNNVSAILFATSKLWVFYGKH